jgi:hypothetical protein
MKPPEFALLIFVRKPKALSGIIRICVLFRKYAPFINPLYGKQFGLGITPGDVKLAGFGPLVFDLNVKRFG